MILNEAMILKVVLWRMSWLKTNALEQHVVDIQGGLSCWKATTRHQMYPLLYPDMG